MCKIFNKINNIVHYLIVLESHRIDSTDENYIKLINEEIYAIIYKKGLIEVGIISHLVTSNFITK